MNAPASAAVVRSRAGAEVLPDQYFTLRTLALYAGMGVRTLREYLKHPAYPLPHYRIGGKLLIRRSEFDSWMARFRAVPASRINAMVADALRGI